MEDKRCMYNNGHITPIMKQTSRQSIDKPNYPENNQIFMQEKHQRHWKRILKQHLPLQNDEEDFRSRVTQ